jgi:transposase
MTEASLSSRSQEELDELERMAEGNAPTPEIQRRAGVVVASLRGESMKKAGIRFGMNGTMALHWVREFSELGPAGLRRAGDTGNTRLRNSQALVRDLVAGPPPEGLDRWTVGLVSGKLGINSSAAAKALKAEGICLGPTHYRDITLAKRSDEEVAELKRMAENFLSSPKIAARAGAVAALIDGESAAAAGARFGMTEDQAVRWTRSFAWFGPAGLSRMPAGDGPSVLKARPLVQALALSPPPAGRRRWTAALIAKELGLRYATVSKALEAEEIRLVPENLADRILAARNAEEIDELKRMAEGLAASPEIALRAGALVAVLDGETSVSVGRRFGVPLVTVSRWANSFAQLGPQWLLRPVPSKGHDASAVLDSRQLVRDLLGGPPPEGHDSWTVDLIARETSRSRAAVWRTLAAEGICLSKNSAETRILAQRRRKEIEQLRREELDRRNREELAQRSREELSTLERMADGEASSPKVAARAGALVAYMNGETKTAAGERFGMSSRTVSSLASSFASHGPAGLEPKKRAVSDMPSVSSVRQLVRDLASSRPPDGHDRWTRPLIASELGLSVTTVGRALKAEGIFLVHGRVGSMILAGRSLEELDVLKRMAKGDAPSPTIAARAGAILAVLSGDSVAVAGKLFGLTGTTVKRWADSFACHGPAGLEPKPPSFSNERRLVRDLTSGPPPEGHDRWTRRLIAERLGLNVRTVDFVLHAEKIRLGFHTVGSRLLAGRSPEELAVLKRMADGDAPSPKIAVRAGALVALLDGETMAAAGKIFGFPRQTVRRWARLFAEFGPDGLGHEAAEAPLASTPETPPGGEGSR